MSSVMATAFPFPLSFFLFPFPFSLFHLSSFHLPLAFCFFTATTNFFTATRALEHAARFKLWLLFASTAVFFCSLSYDDTRPYHGVNTRPTNYPSPSNGPEKKVRERAGREEEWIIWRWNCLDLRLKSCFRFQSAMTLPTRTMSLYLPHCPSSSIIYTHYFYRPSWSRPVDIPNWFLNCSPYPCIFNLTSRIPSTSPVPSLLPIFTMNRSHLEHEKETTNRDDALNPTLPSLQNISEDSRPHFLESTPYHQHGDTPSDEALRKIRTANSVSISPGMI